MFSMAKQNKAKIKLNVLSVGKGAMGHRQRRGFRNAPSQHEFASFQPAAR